MVLDPHRPSPLYIYIYISLKPKRVNHDQTVGSVHKIKHG